MDTSTRRQAACCQAESALGNDPLARRAVELGGSLVSTRGAMGNVPGVCECGSGIHPCPTPTAEGPGTRPHQAAAASLLPALAQHHPRAVACPPGGAARLPGDEMDLEPAARVLGQNAWPRVRPLWGRPATVQLSQAYQLARIPPCQHGCAHTNYGRQLQSRRVWYRVRVLEGTEGRDTSMAPVGAHSYQASTQAQRHAHRGGRRDAPSRAAAR